MKRTEGDLQQRPGIPFLRKVCTGIIAGAVIALTAVPAMAAEHEIRFDFPGRTVNTGTVNVYKILSFGEELGDNKAVITYAPGCENLFLTEAELNNFTTFLNNESTSFSSEEYQRYMDLVREKINAGAPSVTVDLAGDAKKADVDGLGLYFVGNPDSNVFSLNVTGTNNRRGDVDVSAFFVSLTKDDLDVSTGSYVKNATPKTNVSDPPIPPGGGTPPSGGGGNPPSPGSRRSVTPPSEGSVLGASRDVGGEQPMPEVLGANRLPQTGQLWWPVPVLCILGLGLVGSGLYRRRTAEAVH